jgi:hypothetical protein
VNLTGFARKWPKIVKSLTDSCSSRRFSQRGHSTGGVQKRVSAFESFSLVTFASIFSGEMGGREVAELQHSQKFMKKVDSADIHQTIMITGGFYISWRMAYFTNSSPPVRNS